MVNRARILNRSELMLMLACSYYTETRSKIGQAVSFFNFHCNKFYTYDSDHRKIEVHTGLKGNVLTFDITAENLFGVNFEELLLSPENDVYRLMARAVLDEGLNSPKVTIRSLEDGRIQVRLTCTVDYDSDAKPLFGDEKSIMYRELYRTWESARGCREEIQSHWYLPDGVRRLLCAFSDSILMGFMYDTKHVDVVLFDYCVLLDGEQYTFLENMDQVERLFPNS